MLLTQMIPAYNFQDYLEIFTWEFTVLKYKLFPY